VLAGRADEGAPAGPGRDHVVLTGTLASYTREEAAEAVHRRGEGVRLGLEEDEFPRGRGKSRVKQDKKALGVPVLDEAGLDVLLSEGPAAAAGAAEQPAECGRPDDGPAEADCNRTDTDGAL